MPGYLQSYESLTTSVTRLEVGDYLVDSRLLVERKTVRDFAISVVDGRLFKQACRLGSSARLSVLVIEGSGGLDDLGVSRESLQGALVCLTVVLGLPVLRARNSEETAKLILFAAEQMKRGINGSIKRSGYRPKGKYRRQIFILQGLPGIGPARAESLLKVFGSIEAVMKADVELLAGVPGIGQSIARKIREIVIHSESGLAIEDSCQWGPVP